MCRQEAQQSARTSSGQAKYTDIFNGKCVQCKRWKLVHVCTFQCGKAEQWKFLLHPPSAWGPSKKRSATPPGKQSYWCFSMSWLAQCPGICKNRFFDFDCRNLGKRLARTLHNPSNRLKGESGAGTLLAETRQNPAQPGGTELAKAWNPAEPSGTRRSGRTQRNPAEPGGNRRNPAEPGGTRWNLAEPGGTRRKPGGNLAEPGGKKVSWRGGWLGV